MVKLIKLFSKLMLRIEYKILSIGCKLKKAVQFYQMWLKWCDILNEAAEKKINEKIENNLKT